MTDIDISRAAVAAFEHGRRFATVTIAGTEGTVSRTEGKMLVYEDGEVLGTVGGGYTEHEAKKDALECLNTGKGGLFTYGDTDPGALYRNCVTVLIEVSPRLPLLAVVGGGHVGRNVLRLGKYLGYETRLFDDRDPSALHGAVDYADRFVPVTDYEADMAALDLPEDASVVLCTYSHDTDARALAGLLKHKFLYLGMLASRKKREKIYGLMAEKGYTQETLRQIHSPIGLPLGGDTPEEVAFSVVAEIQQNRCGKTSG